MRVLMLVAAATVLSGDQVRSQCPPAREARSVSGTVHDPAGTPLAGTLITVDDTECGAVVDSLGTYTLSAPTGFIRLRAQVIGRPVVLDSLSPGRDDARVDFVLDEYARRVKDWTRFEDRPPTPSIIEGVAGCYWIGVRGAWPEVVELRDDGTVPEIHRYVGLVLGVSADYTGDPSIRGTWRLQDDPPRVTVDVGAGPTTIPMFEFDFTPEVDWSAVPAVLYHLSGALRYPDTFDSFVTRVDCEGDGPSG